MLSSLPLSCARWGCAGGRWHSRGSRFQEEEVPGGGGSRGRRSQGEWVPGGVSEEPAFLTGSGNKEGGRLGWKMGGEVNACSDADGGKPGCQAQHRRWDWRNLPRESELKCCQTLDICHHSSSSHSCTASPSARRGAHAAFTGQAGGGGERADLAKVVLCPPPPTCKS